MFKYENGNWGFGFDFTVDPLPFSTMSGYPYPPTETYYTDSAYQDYLRDWNTRIIEPETTPQSTLDQNGLLFSAPLAFFFVVTAVYVSFKFAALFSFYLKRGKITRNVICARVRKSIFGGFN